MKVLQLSSEKSWRGGEQQIAYLILYLVSQNVDVVVCCRKNSAFSKWCKNHNIKYFEAAFKNGIDIKTAWTIKKIAKTEKVDLINSHSGKSHSLLYLATKLGMKKPIIVHRRVDFPLKTKGFSLAKYNLPQIKFIVCVSDAISKIVKARVANPQRVKTVYSGINPHRFHQKKPTYFIHDELQISRDKMLIANISAISPHKDYETFLLTANEVLKTRNDCHFLIVGDGPDTEKIKSQTQELQLQHDVSFLGFRTDVPDIFRELTLFLITSKTEGLGTTVIDAMHNQIPVVATRAGGIPELVEDKKEGFLCDTQDFSCLSAKIIELLDSPHLRKEMGQKALLKSRQFTSEKMGEKVLQIYKEAISS